MTAIGSYTGRTLDTMSKDGVKMVYDVSIPEVTDSERKKAQVVVVERLYPDTEAIREVLECLDLVN